MDTLMINLLNGLSWGTLLFLISSGLTAVFGVLGVLNFAHGSLFMLGAYLGMQFMKWTSSFWVGLLIGPVLVAFVGVIMEMALLRPVYGRDVTFQLLLTFAVLLVLDDAVRIIWGPGYHVVDPPEVLAGSVTLFGQSYPVYRIFLMAAGPAVGILLWFFFRRTRWGKIIRAAAFDREMAEGIGLKVPRIFTLVFAMGTWLAALGGALSVPYQSLGPSLGEKIIIESFIVVVIGGMGSFPGAFVGAVALGLLESFGTMFAGRVQMALPYMLLALVLLVRPAGLFGKEA
ncbi:branched-chain amino acid ABC transporter permease [Thermodesulforhabdus norvegica]|uniref:Amino acid/amide ABC transporter membrane protein 1, HAAT family n=1 Tax=Thermodesulforhabdus norvegica TaxID=39841 RepID=A0A1I4TPH1_9BACT|nr:branched-chain amino acid ABC transporter permease [Thermodesulforhabdus norvegica]SFM78467.1 amino acid/amide ABC transporter membrane protein 1, HAAT family [Thermodesulforhabdus norvegica]